MTCTSVFKRCNSRGVFKRCNSRGVFKRCRRTVPCREQPWCWPTHRHWPSLLVGVSGHAADHHTDIGHRTLLGWAAMTLTNTPNLKTRHLWIEASPSSGCRQTSLSFISRSQAFFNNVLQLPGCLEIQHRSWNALLRLLIHFCCCICPRSV